MLSDIPPDIDGYVIARATQIIRWEEVNFTEEDYDRNFNEFMVSVY
ncbi:MAG: hypothetical protein J0L69_12960 [Bacteroidetes bacterium]|nr:hypothetical protein [Bacteroidota bacterium]